VSMTSRTSEFDLGFQALVADVASAIAMETALGGKGSLKIPKLRGRQRKSSVLHPALSTEPRDPVEIAEAVLTECNRKRKAIEDDTVQYCTDEEMFKMARFTDKFNLRPYERFLHYVPRLVNVVTVFGLHALDTSIFLQLSTKIETTSAPVRSWQRPFPSPEAALRCHSTYTASLRAAATHTTHQRNSVLCS